MTQTKENWVQRWRDQQHGWLTIGKIPTEIADPVSKFDNPSEQHATPCPRDLQRYEQRKDLPGPDEQKRTRR
jgi:hypothetical protein